MCENNFEGKVLSPSSDDDNDTIPKDWEEVKKPSKKKRSRKNKFEEKVCNTCGQDILSNERRKSLIYKDKYHQVLAKGYCKDHERTYSGHKCKPHWCGDCDYLVKYEIIIKESKYYEG